MPLQSGAEKRRRFDPEGRLVQWWTEEDVRRFRERTLKALLRSCKVDPPRVHDVSDVLVAEKARLPAELAGEVETLTQISRELRRDRDLAFYGAEDLTPTEFYSRADADRARESASRTVRLVKPCVPSDG